MERSNLNNWNSTLELGNEIQLHSENGLILIYRYDVCQNAGISEIDWQELTDIQREVLIKESFEKIEKTYYLDGQKIAWLKNGAL